MARNIRQLLGWLALPLLISSVAASAQETAGQPVKPACDSACLEDLVVRYMEAFVVRDPSRLPWSDRVRFSENNVMLQVGDGSWNVADGEYDSRLIFSDPQTGNAGYFGAISRRGKPAYFGMRLKADDQGRIAEVEVLINQPDPEAELSPAGGDPTAYEHFPEMFAILPPAQRTQRRRMIDLADGYFSTLQLNDGELLTRFTVDCTRQENGFQSALNPEWDRPEASLSCGEQFETGNFIFDCAVRDRDYMLVNEERGLVLARAFIDHCGLPEAATLADGTLLESWISEPGSLAMLELFHITDGAIDRVEVVHINVPYAMPSVWRRDSD